VSDPVRYDRKEAAAICGRSVTTIRRYQRDGKLPAEVKDGCTRYTQADLVACGLLKVVPAVAPLQAVPALPVEPTAVQASTDVAVLVAKLEAAETRIGELTGEVTFLRSLVSGRAA
jgi:hypothetical protein